MPEAVEQANRLKKNWWKILAVAFAVSIFYALIHGMLPSDNNPANVPSVIAKQGLLPVAFILYGALWFAALGGVFVFVERNLPGGRALRGLLYGSFLCAIVFLIYFEPLPSVSSFYVNIAWMLGDGLPLILFGLILGSAVAPNPTQSYTNTIDRSLKRTDIIAVVAVPAVYLIARLFGYTVLGIYSSFFAQTAQTLAWVLVFGFGIGFLYVLLRPAFNKGSPVRSALFFGFAVFGVYLFLFNFAYFLIVSLPFSGYLDMFARSLVDVAGITAGVFLFETLRAKLGGK